MIADLRDRPEVVAAADKMLFTPDLLNYFLTGEKFTEYTIASTGAVLDAKKFDIATDKTTVGDALLELGLIAGEEGAYGLYVKQVNGITADYDVDQTYWAFYVNGEYGMTGVDATDIEAGATYSFKVEK